MERLHEMRSLFVYGRESIESKAKNFVRQAVFMKDFEDDFPWKGDFLCFFPTYQDMTLKQLRGYFTWRTHVRRGEFPPIPTSAAYLYIYELLNGIGADSPEDALKKMEEFEAGYLDSDVGDGRMRKNLRRWMLEYAVLEGVSPEIARRFADKDMLERDGALSVLQNPETRLDEELFAALCFFGGKKQADSPVITMEPSRGKHLFCEVWRSAAAAYQENEKYLFTLCFGEMVARPWFPFANALYYRKPIIRANEESAEYRLDDCRSFYCRQGNWFVRSYDKLYFDRDRLKGLLHETDARLRRYLKTGRYLKEKSEDGWAVPIIEAVIEKDRRGRQEEARPQVTIDFSSLDKIRSDAVKTRDSLLTEEASEIGVAKGSAAYDICTAKEPEEAIFANEKPMSSDIGVGEGRPALDLQNRNEDYSQIFDRRAEASANKVIEDGGTDSKPALVSESPLNSLQIQILRMLLEGEDVSDIMKEKHLMPSIVADEINEALFDDIGDAVLLCDEDILSLVEDYREDLEELLRTDGDA